ncbi:MAG: hypothetical protein WA705_17425 [Candidatus Ozemobacteraceae bacterium]
MRSEKKVLFGLVVSGLVLLSGVPGFSCDVNLVSLITGENPSDAFSLTIIKLASETRALGQAISDPDTAKKNMVTLMKTWVEFDNRFSQTPPEWAKTDSEWNGKIKSVADFIGRINTDLQAGKTEMTHGKVLRLSEQIFHLLDTMPTGERQKCLMRIFRRFVEFAEAFETQDGKKFGEDLHELSADISVLKTLMASGSENLMADLEGQVKQLRELYQLDGASLTMKVKYGYLGAEDCFKKMNENLRKGTK